MFSSIKYWMWLSVVMKMILWECCNEDMKIDFKLIP